jgi:hypothetical protein
VVPKYSCKVVYKSAGTSFHSSRPSPDLFVFASARRRLQLSAASLALLELDGIHGDEAADQHDGSGGGAKHHGAALGLLFFRSRGTREDEFWFVSSPALFLVSSN